MGPGKMKTSEVLIDGYNRVQQLVHRLLDGLPPKALTARLDPDANTIGWLVWHMARVQDDHLADAFDGEQVWTSQGWVERMSLPFDASATGYAQSSADVGAVDVPAETLLGYLDAVHARSVEYLTPLTDTDLDRIVDDAWDPPVTLGVRLISVLGDGLQHAGQASLIRGVLERQAD